MSTQPDLFQAAERKTKKRQEGPQADCVRFWEDEWLRTRGYKWVWTSKHAALVAQALKMAGTVDEFRVRTRNLLSSIDPFLKKAAAPGLLVSHWNHPVVARRPPTYSSTAPRPSSPRPSEPPRATLPEGWGARMAAALRSRAGLENVLRELDAKSPPTASSATSTAS